MIENARQEEAMTLASMDEGKSQAIQNRIEIHKKQA